MNWFRNKLTAALLALTFLLPGPATAFDMWGSGGLGFGSGSHYRVALQYLFNGFPSTLATGSGSALVADYAGVLRKATSPTAAIEGGRLVTEYGPDEVANGAFASDTLWDKSGHWTISGGVASMPNTSSFLPLQQELDIDAGINYLVTFDVTAVTGTMMFGTRNPGVSSTTLLDFTTTGTKTVEFTGVASEKFINFSRKGGFSASCTIDNVSVKSVTRSWYDTLTDGAPLQPSAMVKTVSGGSVKRYIDYPTIQRNQAYALNFKVVAVASDGIRRWYTCTTAGTSAASAPSFGVSGTTADNDVVWTYGGYATLNHRRVLGEPAVTSYALHNRDLTNAVWVKSNCTAAKDQTGVGAVASTASSLTASANAGTCLQSITLASGARTFAPYVKRITGTGTVEITLNGGTNWTDITASLSTSAWYRGVVTATLANPQVGFRLGTSGDKIAVDYAGLQGLGFATSPSETTTTTVTRPATVNSIASAGRIGAQNYAVWGEVRPSAGVEQLNTSSLVGFFDSRVDASNTLTVGAYIKVSTPTIRLLKKDGTIVADISYTPTAGVPLQYIAAWTDQGMCIATRALNGADWSSWSTWATNANTDPAPIAATFEIGSRNGANQFAGNYPMFATKSLTPRATLAEYQADLLDAKGWNYIGQQAAADDGIYYAAPVIPLRPEFWASNEFKEAA